ncbi:MAG: ATP-dependent DNA helicase, partial [Patescibacteria group bacterium]
LRNYLDNPKLKFLRSPRSTFHYLHSIKQALQNIKREGFFVSELEELVGREQQLANPRNLSKAKKIAQEKRLGKLQELSQLYKAYQKFLAKNNRYDFEDMILKVIKAFEDHEELLQEYQEQLLYFLVDEYQDTNSAQNKILDLLASYWKEAANVFVVGDPNQTIYRFQGASFENVLSFLNRYSKSVVINLEQGYRCSQDIYNAAAETLANQKLNFSKSPELFSILKRPLQGRVENLQTIRLSEAATDTAEQVALAEEIKKLLNKKVSPENIAILFKKNKETTRLIETLNAWKIPYKLERDEDILQTEIIRQILTVMQVVLQLRNGEQAYDLYEILLYHWSDLDTLEVLKLAREANKEKISLEGLLEMQNEKCKIKKYFQQLVNLGKFDLNMTFLEFVPELFEKIGFRDYLIKDNNARNIQLINAFYSEIKTISKSEKHLKLERFLEIIAAFLEQNIGVSKKILLGEEKGVTISTVHGAKGKEWDYVFLPNLIDKHWGNARSPLTLPLPDKILRFQAESKQDKNEDDRRLFYVGLTRAKKQVFLSFSKLNEENKKEQLQAVFLAELLEADLDILNKKYQINDNQKLKNSKKLLPAPIFKNTDKTFRDWLLELIKDFELSPTALDIYLRDKEEFFYKVLLRLPQAKTSALSFGTAVHKALEFLMRQGKNTEKLPKLNLVLDVFRRTLEREQLSLNDFESRIVQGKEVISSYYEQLADFNLNNIKTLEYKFGSDSRKVVFDKDIYLTGKVDRIDWVNKEIKVIDYKTGSAKSRNHIEGKIKSANLSEAELELPESIRGRYKRQLVFYKLLSQLDKTFKYKIVEAELDFVEAAGKKTSRVSFEITDQEVEDLKEVIRKVMGEIRSLEFF